MRPVLFEAFGWRVASAHVFAGLAALAAFLVLRGRRQALRVSVDGFWELVAFLAGGVFAGSLAFHALGYGTSLAANLAVLRGGEVPGGSFLGTFPGAALALWLWSRWRRRSLAPLADALAEAAALGLAVMRVGCLLNGCCHGRPTGSDWGLVFDAPCAVPFALRGMHLHPTQVYDGLGALALYLILSRVVRPLQARGRLAPGDGFWTFVGLYGVLRVLVEPLRGGDLGRFFPLGLDLVVWTGGLGAAAAAFVLARRVKEPRVLYGLLVAAAFTAVAGARLDLVTGAAQATADALAAGGAARGKVLGEVVLFCGILAFAWREIPLAPRPARDGAVLIVMTALGWLAEAWGTRAGVWTYYTGEAPPLWIVPAWPLGALVIGRLAGRARERRGAVPPGLRAACALFAVAAAAASSPAAGAAVAALLFFSRHEEGWLLPAALAAVFFADLWGTTNGCWRYAVAGEPGGLWRGIAFGMGFDAAVVLGGLALVSAWERRSRRPRSSAGA